MDACASDSISTLVLSAAVSLVGEAGRTVHNGGRSKAAKAHSS